MKSLAYSPSILKLIMFKNLTPSVSVEYESLPKVSHYTQKNIQTKAAQNRHFNPGSFCHCFVVVVLFF